MIPSAFRVLVVLELAEPYAQAILRGICRRGGQDPRLRLQIMRLFPSNFLPQRLEHCDAVIASVVDQNVAEILQASMVPLVNVSNRGTTYHPNSVVSDLPGAFVRALQHFQERGLSHVASLGKPEAEATLPKEYRKILTYHGGIPYRDGWPLIDHLSVEKVGNWLKEAPHPLGVFCISDGLAAQLCQICERCEISVPDEVAIVGSGNDEVLTLTNRPTLSSVEMRFEEVGVQAVRMMLEILDGNIPDPPLQVIPGGSVLVRQSSNIYAVKDPYVSRALKLMDEHVTEPLDISDLAGSLQISRRMLEQRFKKQMGMPPASYLRAKRLRQAAEMLANTNLQITEIAYATGFANAAHFCTLFRKHQGTSPRHYRDQTRKQ